MFRPKSKTEKSLFAVTGVLFLVLAITFLTKDPIGTDAVANESSDGGSEESTTSGSENSEGSEQSEQSEESEESEESEQSEQSEASEESVESSALFRTTSVGEKSEVSVESVSSEGELSEESVQSESSVKSEEFQIVSTDGNTSIVKRNERLFFLIPVEIESQVVLDEQGNVVDEKKSFFNWLLSILSY